MGWIAIASLIEGGNHPECLKNGKNGFLFDSGEPESIAQAISQWLGQSYAELKTFSPIQEPLIMNYRVNAEAVADSHWIHDPAQGGGRIIGEVCHFVDLMTFLCGGEPDHVVAMPTPKIGKQLSDNACLQITFRNGSV